VITWEELLQAEQNLMPPQLALGPLPVSPVAMPGKTTLKRSWEG
jgi:hypothetical protein